MALKRPKWKPGTTVILEHASKVLKGNPLGDPHVRNRGTLGGSIANNDPAADYPAAFGGAPGALMGTAIMTDSDNTRSTARAWYGPVSLGPTAAAHR